MGSKQKEKCSKGHDLSKTRKRFTDGHTRCETCYVERHRTRGKNRNLRDRYCISSLEFDALYEKQNRVCAICGSDNWGVKHNTPRVDHDHITGKIRGLLCNNCNTGLGMFKDSSDLLASALSYLRSGD